MRRVWYNKPYDPTLGFCGEVFLLEKIKFKSALFGFKRRQVLSYVNQTCQGYEQQLQEQKSAHESYRRQAEVQLQELSDSLENSRIVCAEQGKRMEGLEQELSGKERCLTEATALADELMNRLQAQSGQMTLLEQELEKSKDLLARKDTVIASQAVEVSRLQEQVSKLEVEFTQLRGQAQESSALVDCLNVLHSRNRDLLSQIARLEARLEDATHGGVVEEHARKVTKNQQMITSTEQLFTALRKEIGDALESISSKIESGGIAESEDGNYFVDMANL